MLNVITYYSILQKKSIYNLWVIILYDILIMHESVNIWYIYTFIYINHKL